MSRPRGFVVVTGSELVRGDRRDRNGPFLASELMRLGLEPARISIVGDDPAELEAALREGLDADLCLVSGGLGPTHDDRTVELVARAAGRELVVDEALEAEIESTSRAIAERFGRPYADFTQGVRKQATLVEGSVVVGIAGTAPALVLETERGAAIVLPGPPEMQQSSASSPSRSAASSSAGSSPTIEIRAGSRPSRSSSAARNGPFRSRRSPRTSSLPVTTTNPRGRLKRPRA